MPIVHHRQSHADCSHCQIRRAGMFCNFFPDTLADFSSIGRLVSNPEGTVLMREDDRCDQVHVICSGQIKLSCTSKEGKTLNLKIALPGDVLGLGAIVTGAKFEVTAETLVPSVTKVIRREDFLAFLQRHGEASWNATQALATEYKSAFAGARSLALSSSVSGRVARLLLDLAHATPSEPPNLKFNLALTHDDLAEFTSTSRETVTRTLGKFQKDKLIQIRGVAVQILRPEQLAEMVA